MPELPLYSVVAYSGTGKTTFLEKLIPALKRRGLRVAVVKHDAHGFELDRPGKDSWRMTQAGADVTVLTSADKTAVMENRPVTIEQILAQLHDVDLVLTEGYKHGVRKKIALFRRAAPTPLPPDAGPFFALVTDLPPVAGEAEDTPRFDLDDAEGLADLILADMAQRP